MVFAKYTVLFHPAIAVTAEDKKIKQITNTVTLVQKKNIITSLSNHTSKHT